MSFLERKLNFIITVLASGASTLLLQAVRRLATAVLNHQSSIPPPTGSDAERNTLQSPVAMPIAAATGKHAVLFDSGATALMTNKLTGMIGTFIDKKSTFSTAMGSLDTSKYALFRRTLYGANGNAVTFNAYWWYVPSLPFDIAGKAPLREMLGALYVDAYNDAENAFLRLRAFGDVKLTLGRSPNKLEWLAYTAPPLTKFSQNIAAWTAEEAAALTTVAASTVSPPTDAIDIAMPNSSGVGMGPLAKALSPLEVAIIDHNRKGHVSLRRQWETHKVSTGTKRLPLTLAGLKELAKVGCDICNAYKIKLTDPRSKTIDDAADSQADTAFLLYYDQFGKVSVPSLQYNYQYAHMWVSPHKNVAWLLGSKDILESTILHLHKVMTARIEAWFPGSKVNVIRMDSLSSNKGATLAKWFADSLIHPEYSPPGQHAYLGDVERWWYPVFVRALMAMRQRKTPKAAWFDAMQFAIDVECTLASRMSTTDPISGYERATGRNVTDDMYCFYAPGRFALDAASLPNKWAEKARAGFWLHRDVDFVMSGKPGSAVWWDGHIHRTVVGRFAVQEGGFLNLTAPDNKYLPMFPHDDNDPIEETVVCQDVTSDDKSSQQPIVDNAPPAPQPAAAPPTAIASDPVPEPLSRAKAVRATRPPDTYKPTCVVCYGDVVDSCLLCGMTAQVINIAAQPVVPLSVQQPLPTMNIVLNLYGGLYDSVDNISAKLRALGKGVVDIDNDPRSGGQLADMTAPTVFNLALALVDAKRIIGGISAQKCALGSVLRLRRGESDTADAAPPPTVIDQQFPDGRNNLPAQHAKELHVNKLLSFRTTTLFRRIYENGGWYFAECPSVRGNVDQPSTYDPNFAEHSNIFGMKDWQELKQATGGVLVTAAMCAVRAGHPQKLEDYIMSGNLAAPLGQKLASLVCQHPIGTHASSFAGAAFGKLDAKSSERWLPEVCEIIASGLQHLIPDSGPSLQLGAEGIADFAVRALQLRDADHWMRLAWPEGRRAEEAAVCATLADTTVLPNNLVELATLMDADLDPLIYDDVAYVAVAASAGTTAMWLEPISVTRYTSFDAPYVVLAVTDAPFAGEAPQTELALKLSPDRLHWEAADQHEIDTLQHDVGQFEEVISNGTEKYWRTRFVRRRKVNAVTNESKRRSRLVCLGTQHRKGIEYTAKHTATPMFSTTLMLIGKAVVQRRFKFSFDLKQFFQRTDCEPPCGTIYVLPPPRFQRQVNGHKVLWKWNKWLQGAPGAGHAARSRLENHLKNNDIVAFKVSSYDPSLYIHEHIEFTLHGDDGTGSATTEEHALLLKQLLVSVYGDSVEWHGYDDVLGFACHETADGVLTITAPKHIEALRHFVANDPQYQPSSPFTKEFSTLEPAPEPQQDSVEYYDMASRVAWMQQAGGHIAHILKVRPDVAGPHNMVVRYAHRPCHTAIRCMKHLIFYLINTKEIGIRIVPDDPSRLVWRAPLPDNYVLDLADKPLAYHVVLDGALSIDRSISAIIHMFAGVACHASAFRQHSVAVDAYANEAFTASTGAAQSIAYNGILTEIGLAHEYPTPIFSDNLSTRMIAMQEATLKKSIYIARRVRLMQDGVADGEYAFYQCKGETNPANPLTKVTSGKEAAAARRYYMNM